MSARKGPRQHGFSLVEVLIVIIIIGILAAIAIPMFLGQRDKAHNSSARAGGHTIAIALLTYVTQLPGNEPWPATCDRQLLVTDTGILKESEWPQNPWTGDDMHPVPDVDLGNYAYERYTTADDKVRYHLTVYLKDTAPFEVL